MKAGLRLGCVQCSTEVIVVRAPDDEVTLTCGGSPLGDVGAPKQGDGHDQADAEGTLLGKRYTDADDTLELLCTKGGPGALASNGAAMTVKGAKPLPSSD